MIIIQQRQHTSGCLKALFPYLSLFLYDDNSLVGNRGGQQGSLGRGQNEVSMSLDHRVQVLPLWLAAVVHSNLI